MNDGNNVWNQKEQFAGHVVGTAGRTAKARDKLSVTGQNDIRDLVDCGHFQLGKALLQVVQRIALHILDQAALVDGFQ